MCQRELSPLPYRIPNRPHHRRNNSGQRRKNRAASVLRGIVPPASGLIERRQLHQGQGVSPRTMARRLQRGLSGSRAESRFAVWSWKKVWLKFVLTKLCCLISFLHNCLLGSALEKGWPNWRPTYWWLNSSNILELNWTTILKWNLIGFLLQRMVEILDYPRDTEKIIMVVPIFWNTNSFLSKLVFKAWFLLVFFFWYKRWAFTGLSDQFFYIRKFCYMRYTFLSS